MTFDPAAHPDHPGNSRKHLPGLDGIRGLAILLVMFSHFIVAGGNLGTGTPWTRLFRSGYLGVDLFFVLSGFLITGILIDSKNAPGYFRVFYIRRALRIFPLYYLVLLVAQLSAWFLTPQDKLTGIDSMAWYWAYASNIGMAIKGGWLESPTWVTLGHFWSLAVEEQFYLVWPLLVYLVPVKWIERLCLLLVIASPWVYEFLLDRQGVLGAYVSTLGRVGALAAGGWLAIQWRRPEAWMKVRVALLPVAIVAAIALLLERTFLDWWSPAEPSIVLVLSACCVGLAAREVGIGRSFRQPVLRWLGTYSYGIYVYHHALRPVWRSVLWDRVLVPLVGTGWAATIGYVILATSCTLALAWLSWKCFEAPVLSLKSRFAYRPSAD